MLTCSNSKLRQTDLKSRVHRYWSTVEHVPLNIMTFLSFLKYNFEINSNIFKHLRPSNKFLDIRSRPPILGWKYTSQFAYSIITHQQWTKFRYDRLWMYISHVNNMLTFIITIFKHTYHNLIIITHYHTYIKVKFFHIFTKIICRF